MLRESRHVRNHTTKNYGQIKIEQWKSYSSYVNCGKAEHLDTLIDCFLVAKYFFYLIFHLLPFALSNCNGGCILHNILYIYNIYIYIYMYIYIYVFNVIINFLFRNKIVLWTMENTAHTSVSANANVMRE